MGEGEVGGGSEERAIKWGYKCQANASSRAKTWAVT
jgi:hypothetical protein